VVLWVAPFVYSDLVAKKGLHEAGFRVSHLSRPRHGFSRTRFGIRILNPIWTRIEDRYLEERVRVGNGSGSALERLRARLQENRIVSITVGDEARRTVRVAFFDIGLRLATGPLHLARTAKAVLLPVFAVRKDREALEVHVESPLCGAAGDDGDGFYETAALGYAERLERYVLAYPNQWQQFWGLD
jgi:lauroyl/myristoyl acyltransferase